VPHLPHLCLTWVGQVRQTAKADEMPLSALFGWLVLAHAGALILMIAFAIAAGVL
jgi:hypothetical protein